MTSRPFLRWAGSKRKLLPVLSKYWTGSGEYFEPFMGSACLFFKLAPPVATLSDINEELVEAFVMLRDHHEEVVEHLKRIRLGEKSYYSVRSSNPRTLTSLQRAARFIFLNRFCFNGLYRTNRVGEFNVPYSPTGSMPKEDQFAAASGALRIAKIVHADFETALTTTKAGDFVYMDPPYAVSNRRIFCQYNASSFGISDIERLAAVARQLDNKGVRFLISYAVCKEALKAFSSWSIRRVYVHRNISGFVRSRRKAAELLVSNEILE